MKKQKKAALINDISCLGRCSLTAAMPILSACGIESVPVPTGIFSAHTEFEGFVKEDLTDKMEQFVEHWKSLGIRFDCIYSGYLANRKQTETVQRFLLDFKKSDTLCIVDPVMGDDGQTYDVYTPELLSQMKQLVSRADIITPNLTEFCLLTDMDYHALLRPELSEEDIIRRLQTQSRILCGDNEKTIIITGICRNNFDSAPQIGNLYLHGTDCSFTSTPYIGGSYSGTGDLFASCMAGGIARGDALPSLLKTTGEFLENSLKDSVREKVPYNDGVNYEKFLSILMPGKENV